MTLAELLAVAAPNLKGLTLWRGPDGWQANLTNDRQSWRVAVSADPVAALAAVLANDRGPAPEPSKSVFD